ncbi:hypothetical protein STEG23_034478, partial [Scotinomys teguina]
KRTLMPLRTESNPVGFLLPLCNQSHQRANVSKNAVYLQNSGSSRNLKQCLPSLIPQ